MTLQKDGSLIISNWTQGQAKHPLYGFGLLQNVEIFENPGIAKLKNRAVADSTISPTKLPIAEVYSGQDTFTLTNGTGGGTLYKNGVAVSGATGLANAWDLAIYKDYVWVSHGTVVSCYGPLSLGGAQWFVNASTGYTDGYYGKLVVGQDDYLYRLSGNLVYKLGVSGGVVGVQPTVTTITSLDLKDGQFGVTIAEFGRNLITGTQGGITYSDRGNYSDARLYPWNRQAGTLGNSGLADLPVIFNENGINAIVSHANKLYISAGTQGNIYVTDGANYNKIATLPYTKSGVLARSSVYPNAMAVSTQGTLLIGLSTYDEGARGGIYEININDPKYPVSFRTISTGETDAIEIGFVGSVGYQTLKFGWSDNSSYGVDTTDFRMYSSYGGVIEGELDKVGSSLEPRTFEHIEWCLADPLVSGQNIRISFRKNLTEDYTPINTWGYATGTGVKAVGSVMSFADSASIADAEYLQIKIEGDQALTTLAGNNINLISVRLW